MKAVNLAGPRRLEVVDVDKPAPDGRAAVIKVTSCGICGSDIHYWEAGIGMNGLPGLIMGHEFAGVIEDAGFRGDLKIGDRVTAIPLNPCGECTSCREGMVQMCQNGMKRPAVGQNSPGAYAEYVSLRSDMVRRIPDAINDLEAAMIEPAAVCLHAVRRSGIKAGDRVLVVGCGTIGLLCASWARINGASRIFMAEVNDARAASAENLHDADEIVDGKDPKMSSKIRKATSGGVDIAIDASASVSGINSALMALKVRGALVLAGISLSAQELMTLPLTVKELSVRGSFGYEIADFELAMDSIARRALVVGKYISRTVSLDEVQQAFETLHSGTSGEVKIIMRPHSAGIQS
ncbi:MAG TPA: alcohol dehydrogenase catalytic domain-containing protein [Desulfomonilia bacterium]|nr:alcohol dehydrogenase catalytic domain-containing protein [Desulfomonilia bacterium]